MAITVTTRRTSQHRNRILDGLALRGDENVLDIGCGRGAVLNAVAARRHHGGRITGIDSWSTADQIGQRARGDVAQCVA